MRDDRPGDAAETFLKASATWEPPDGFSLRVISATRSDAHRETQVPRSLAVIGVTARLRSHLTALVARREGTVWVLRQYWNLLRGE
jgi:hypothetical protein